MDNKTAEDNKITIFLSHSHKDREKVRKIRDILEALECEPLIFFLKCLDDKNTELEQFIMDEIEARNIFVYCKSQNAEQSKWCQKELDYIKSFDEKRLYTIDIETDFSLSMISFLQTIADILKRNRIFISYAHKDKQTYDIISSFLRQNGYQVNDAQSILNFNEVYAPQIKSAIDTAVKEGVFMSVITANSSESIFCRQELFYALSKQNEDSIIIPVIVQDNQTDNNILKSFIDIKQAELLTISQRPTDNELNKLLSTLNRRTRENI